MTEKRAFEAKVDELLHAYGCSIGRYGNNPVERLNEARAAVLQAYDEAAGREGEPVAWTWEKDSQIQNAFPYDPRRGDYESWQAKGWSSRPLYLHPAKADAAADWVCVPREPTEEMQVAGRKKLAEVCDRFDEARNTARSSIEFWQIVGHHPAEDIWNAMLAASPARVGEGEKGPWICQWTYDDDGFWNQGCGGAWSFSDGGPDENNCRFCPSCGKHIDAREAQG